MKKSEADALIRKHVGPDAADRRDKSIEVGKSRLANEGDALSNPEGNPPKRIQRDNYGESFIGKYLIALGMARSPTDLAGAAAAAIKLGEHDVAKALQATVFADGGALVPEEFSTELIEFLRQQVVVRAMGARVLPMDATTLILGRQNTSATSTYAGEGVNIPTSQLSTDQIKLVARKLTSLTPVSNDLIRRAAFSADALVRDDLVDSAAERMDLAFIRGDGASDTPKGIRNLVAAANVFATSGTTVTQVVTDLGRLARLVQESQVPMRSRGWLFSSRTEWFLKTLLDANNNFVFRAEMAGGTLFGFPFMFTDQIPNTLGGGSDESELYFCEFSDQIIGEAVGIQVEVFPGGTYDDNGTLRSGISRDETIVRMIAEHDFQLRHANTSAIMTGVQYGA